MFDDEDMIPIDIKALTLASLGQALYFVASNMAGEGEEPADYKEHAKRLLLALHNLGTIGRFNLNGWAPSKDQLEFEEILKLLERAAESYVYVMKDPQGRHKIGHSDAPEVRRQNVSTGTAGRARLLGQFLCPGGQARKVEQEAQRTLKSNRLPGGEWFDCDEESALTAVRNAWHAIYGKPYSSV